MTFLVENWFIVVGLMAVTGCVAFSVGRFKGLDRAEQEETVKKWLLWAVTQAEKELGRGTGELKLHQVYDLFLQRFPALAMAVPFTLFSQWVDEALVEMKKMLSGNKKIKNIVEG